MRALPGQRHVYVERHQGSIQRLERHLRDLVVSRMAEDGAWLAMGEDGSLWVESCTFDGSLIRVASRGRHNG